MRSYLMILSVLAVLTGSLFRGAVETGVGLLGMFGTLGVFLLGVVGSLMAARWQTSAGVREVEEVLLSLAPEYLITDWGDRGRDWPDYLVVGPQGLTAICLDHTPQSAWALTVGRALERSQERARQTVRLIERRLAEGAVEGAEAVPVEAVVVLTRRRAGENLGEGVAAVNPEQLADHIRSASHPAFLDRRTQVRLTRLLRAG